MRSLRFLPQAHADLTEILQHFREIDSELAHRYTDCLSEALRILRQYPEAGSRVFSPEALRRGIRCWSLRGFEKWLILYTQEGDAVLVARLVHANIGIKSLFEQ